MAATTAAAPGAAPAAVPAASARASYKALPPLHHAVLYEGVERVQQLLEELGQDALMTVDSAGWTALHWASAHGNTACTEALVAAGADANAEARDEIHPLALAKSAEVAVALIAHGADVQAHNRSGRTAVHDAAANGFDGVVKALIKAGASVAVGDVWGITPLHLAASADRVDVVRTLLEAGANPNVMAAYGDDDGDRQGEQRPKKGDAPLHWAAENVCVESARLLLGLPEDDGDDENLPPFDADKHAHDGLRDHSGRSLDDIIRRVRLGNPGQVDACDRLARLVARARIRRPLEDKQGVLAGAASKGGADAMEE